MSDRVIPTEVRMPPEVVAPCERFADAVSEHAHRHGGVSWRFYDPGTQAPRPGGADASGGEHPRRERKEKRKGKGKQESVSDACPTLGLSSTECSYASLCSYVDEEVLTGPGGLVPHFTADEFFQEEFGGPAQMSGARVGLADPRKQADIDFGAAFMWQSAESERRYCVLLRGVTD